MTGLAKQTKLAIVGATGFLGREVLKTLDESELLIADPLLLSVGEDVGEMVTCQGEDVITHSLDDADFSHTNVALFCGSPEITQKYAPKAMQAGAMVLDASGGLRQTGILLTGVEPPHPDKLKTHGGVLPQPLAQTLAQVLGLIDEQYPLSEATVSTYQTVAGAGMSAVEDVANKSVALLGGQVDEEDKSHLFAYQAAFNVLPQVGDFTENDQTTAEQNIATDFHALVATSLPLSVSCAYVPIFVGDGLDVCLRFKEDTAPASQQVRDLFSPASGVMVLDNPQENEYATPYGAAETSYVFLSRVRQDSAFKNGLRFWLVADHIRVAQARKLVKYVEALAHQAQ